MLTILLLSTLLAGTEPPPLGDAAAPAPETHQVMQPAVAAPARWPGVMVGVIVGLFAMAAAVGVAVRANMPAEAEETGHATGGGHH